MSEGRLLIVDDSKQGVDILRLLLEDEGFEVHIAHTGPEALKMVARRPPDVVILDVMMPGMTGIEVLQHIRADKNTADLPIIMVTALGDSADIVRGLELGANDYIAKPPQFEVLVARVRTQLKLKQLQDQRKEDLVKLRQLDAIKDKFFQIAAHDLKNPLQNLAVGTNMLGKMYAAGEIDVPDMDIILETMDAAVNTMNVVISDFLNVQTMRSGQVRIQPKEADFNATAQRTLKQFRNYAKEKDIILREGFDADMPDFPFDADRLTQVMSNLIGNAIKFSQPGTTVDVRTFKTPDNARFEVEDNGPGIPEEEMPLLFEEFARLSNHPTGDEKSSGVGLAISRYLVEAHKGQIGCHSVRGEGSIFWFEIPTHEEEETAGA